MLNTITETHVPRAGRAAQKVVVINGSREMLGLLESVLDGGHYDVVFVADTARAYSQVKKDRPNLVVLNVSFDDPIGFQILSMLRLDQDTASIPVLTYMSETDEERADREFEAEESDEAMSLARPEPPMN